MIRQRSNPSPSIRFNTGTVGEAEIVKIRLERNQEQVPHQKPLVLMKTSSHAPEFWVLMGFLSFNMWSTPTWGDGDDNWCFSTAFWTELTPLTLFQGGSYKQDFSKPPWVFFFTTTDMFYQEWSRCHMDLFLVWWIFWSQLLLWWQTTPSFSKKEFLSQLLCLLPKNNLISLSASWDLASASSNLELVTFRCYHQT